MDWFGIILLAGVVGVFRALYIRVRRMPKIDGLPLRINPNDAAPIDHG